MYDGFYEVKKEQDMHYVIFAIIPNTLKGEKEPKLYIDAMMYRFDERIKEPVFCTMHHDDDEPYLWNDNGHWDWYRPGGRWDGQLTGNPQSSDNGFNWDETHQTINNNRLPVSEYLKRGKPGENDFGCFGVVLFKDNTPTWIDRYQDKDWNTTPRDEWVDKLFNILEQFKIGFDIVSLDVHS
jgi:hypothetical protein